MNAPPKEMHERKAISCYPNYMLRGCKSTEMYKRMTVQYVNFLSHRKVYK
jgi:hypothetical protein